MPEATMLEAIILGIIQGLTEFLPVSSSGHLIVASALMEGRPLPLELNLALHVGTMLATFAYFWRDWWQLIVKSLARVSRGQRSFEADVLLPSLVIGTIPAGIIGVLWEHDIERLFHHPLSVAGPLFVVGFIIWWVDRRAPSERRLHDLTVGRAFLIGVAQACALIPGVSRSGSTILAARLQGFERADAARFSFLLGMPAMVGAVVLNARAILTELARGHSEFYVGVLASGLVGCLAIGFLLRFLRRFGFGFFAIYRALLAIAIVWFYL